jgi:hypothetical protein
VSVTCIAQRLEAIAELAWLPIARNKTPRATVSISVVPKAAAQCRLTSGLGKLACKSARAIRQRLGGAG